MTLPWTLQMGTHILNPDYVLAAAIAFVIGFFEAMPTLRLGRIPPSVAFGLMGAAFGWVMQIHMSYALLVPYVAIAFLAASRQPRDIASNTAGLALGALVTASLLMPTWARYGIFRGFGGTQANVHVHPVSPFVALSTLARFFSFASLEVNRFVATDGGKRLVFFERRPWLVPFALPVIIAGLAQPVWMLREWFRAAAPFPEWNTLRMLVAGTVLWVYACYWFVMEPAQAHAFYVVAPIAWIFAAYCWTFVDGPRARRAAAALIALNVVFQVGLITGHADRSLYNDRAVAVAAIRSKQTEMLAHRRAFAIDGGPPSLQDPSRPYDPQRDLELSNSVCSIGRDRVVLWTFTLRNANTRVAFRDVLYSTQYTDAPADQRHEFVRQVWQPGESKTLEVNDKFAGGASCTGATLRILGAEALVPSA
jgi:hypothetical protein